MIHFFRSSPHYYFIILAALVMASCQDSQVAATVSQDPLPSWKEGDNRKAIIDFVLAVTDPASPEFIKEQDRIAVFDNDGTLWSEKPVYFQLFFAMDRVRELAPQHPEWKEQQPFKAVLEDDMETLAGFGEHGILELVMATHAGMTVEEYETTVIEWFTNQKHPRFDRLYTDMVFQPMLELLHYLRQNGFKTFIVSGGGMDFMRPWVEKVYGIPRDQVVGSSTGKSFVIENGVAVIRKEASLDFINDKEGKPVGIHNYIGRKPVFAAGNSDGDLAMLQWTASGTGKRMMLYIHHTDAEREWAYDRNSSVGRLDKGLDEALESGWTIVDMKNDWSVIYPFHE
jgi:phosphoglycolate phosphatase-like HAD superfamily hydrolase